MSQAAKHGGVAFFFLVVFSVWLCLPSAAQTKPIELSLDEVKTLTAEWRGSQGDLDHEAVRDLAKVRRNAEVKVFFGTWCSDSEREVSRLLKILSDLETPPFSVRFFQVEKDKKDPAKLQAPDDIAFLPTFVVTRKGREVGRIVERSPRSLETDLRLLLDGRTEGLISGSEPVIWHYLSGEDAAERNPG